MNFPNCPPTVDERKGRYIIYETDDAFSDVTDVIADQLKIMDREQRNIQHQKHGDDGQDDR